MLCLTREPYETVRIGDSITVVVTKIRGNKVQLGFIAPEGVKILRGELEDRDPPEERTVA